MKIYDYNGRKNLAGERIREARWKKRMSQTELAIKLQLENIIIDRNSVSRIENGTRFIADYELRAFATILDVDVRWLLEIT